MYGIDCIYNPPLIMLHPFQACGSKYCYTPFLYAFLLKSRIWALIMLHTPDRERSVHQLCTRNIIGGVLLIIKFCDIYYTTNFQSGDSDHERASAKGSVLFLVTQGHSAPKHATPSPLSNDRLAHRLLGDRTTTF
jgi:hypothetical protein